MTHPTHDPAPDAPSPAGPPANGPDADTPAAAAPAAHGPAATDPAAGATANPEPASEPAAPGPAVNGAASGDPATDGAPAAGPAASPATAGAAGADGPASTGPAAGGVPAKGRATAKSTATPPTGPVASGAAAGGAPADTGAMAGVPADRRASAGPTARGAAGDGPAADGAAVEGGGGDGAGGARSGAYAPAVDGPGPEPAPGTETAPGPRGARVPAPWVRTRVGTAPGAALALGVLVFVTAFLAAALPRAVDAYETGALRYAVRHAPAAGTVLELTAPQPGLGLPEAAREQALRAAPLAAVHARAAAALPAPLRAEPGQSAYGVRTTDPLAATDPWLPRPDAVPPRFTLAAPSGLAAHATVRTGRLPATTAPVTSGTRRLEAAVTTGTAAALRLRTGSVVHLVTGASGDDVLTVTVTGTVEPRTPEGSYWSATPLLRTAGLAAEKKGGTPAYHWEAALLLHPDAAPALLGTQAKPERYWQFAPATDGLTTRDTPAALRRIASLEGGPDLLRLRAVAGNTATLSTGLETVLAGHLTAREAVSGIVAPAAVGTAAVAAVVLAMAGSLTAARRRDELALLRARGASLTGIGTRLAGEAAVVAVPAAAAGLFAALLLTDGTGWLPATFAAAAVALLACAALPLPAVFRHRRPRAHGERDDLLTARPGRARTVAELTLLVLAAASLQALRGRDPAEAGGPLAAAAPVLVALTAALVLVRLYPVPLRWAARPARRLRGAVGFLALARAGRAPAAGVLPLLALLVALTTAALGGSVLAGVTDARDRAALLATGADVRVSTPGESRPLPAGTATAVGRVPGVREVTGVRIDRTATATADQKTTGRQTADRTTTGRHTTDQQTAGPSGDGPRALTLVGVEPAAYARLARRTGLGAFPATALGRSAGVLDAVASPGLAARLGGGPRRVATAGGDVTVRVVAVRPVTPAAPRGEFLLVDAAGLPGTGVTALLATGDPDPDALRAAAGGLPVRLRAAERAALTDTPLQRGAEGVYAAAVAAGAGYAAVALLLSLLRSAPDRTALLLRLRTLGLGARQGRALVLLEALPQTLLAAGGGVLTAWATVRLVAPGIDLTRLALAAAPALTPPPALPLRADAWALGLPAAGVVVLAALVAAAQSWRPGLRRTPSTTHGPGDTR
ncbi:ABC transporter permease [Streptomyces sp. NPDC101132]|uniref:ABC transporter permease n=1 Tax=Streptomyces sp. NPDC101132 TaxID=3366110 RepID=UPI00381020E9